MSTEKTPLAATGLSEPESYGYTKKEWWMFPLKLMSISVAVIGVTSLDKCHAIPTLPFYCMTFGIYMTAYELLRFVTKAERPENKGVAAL